MITEVLVKGLKSVIARLLTTSSEPRPSTLLNIIFISGVLTITFILAEVFFGLSVYKMLRFDEGYGEGISMLAVALMYVIQAIGSGLMARRCLKKLTTSNIVVKEYKLMKSIFNAFLEGYKSK